jgi:hypothetical protein
MFIYLYICICAGDALGVMGNLSRAGLINGDIDSSISLAKLISSYNSRKVIETNKIRSLCVTSDYPIDSAVGGLVQVLYVVYTIHTLSL